MSSGSRSLGSAEYVLACWAAIYGRPLPFLPHLVPTQLESHCHACTLLCQGLSLASDFLEHLSPTYPLSYSLASFKSLSQQGWPLSTLLNALISPQASTPHRPCPTLLSSFLEMLLIYLVLFNDIPTLQIRAWHGGCSVDTC